MNPQEEFVRELIDNPIATYKRLRSEFENKNATFGQFEELWPVVEMLWKEVNSKEILDLCAEDLALALQRKLIVQDLRHISLRNRIVTPYVETIRCVERTLGFFDVCIRYRELRDQKVELKTFLLEEENPRNRSLSYYHRYRYLYYYYWLVDKVPDVFLLPTAYPFTAREMMRFRCVPVFILGVATNKLYVDEFEQTPVEFFMHDANHARRQYMANLAWQQKLHLISESERLAWYERSAEFSKKLLDSLEPSPDDTEEERAMKDLKVIILFEVAHEDAEPLMPETVSESLQRMEGFRSRFEVPFIDDETGLMDVKDTIETGISTLAYVRHKLQNEFYDRGAHADDGVVAMRFRTTKYIARAAYELLRDIGATPGGDAATDADGHVAEEWLLQRACSFGPEVVHESVVPDPDLEKLSGDIREVNVKNYFQMDAEVGRKMQATLIKADARRPALAQSRTVADGLVFTVHEGRLKILLMKRNFPPQADAYALPGGFLWEGEDTKACIARVLREKIGISGLYLEQLYTFDSPLRDPRGHIISTAYIGLVDHATLSRKFNEHAKRQEDATLRLEDILFDVTILPDIAFDHAQIIELGLERLRTKVAYSNIASGILPPEFSQEEFMKTYTAILGDNLAVPMILSDFIAHRAIVPTQNSLFAFAETKPFTFDAGK